MSNGKKNAPGQPGVNENAAFTDTGDKPQVAEVESVPVEENKEEEFELPEDPVLKLQKVAELLALQHTNAPSAEQLTEWKQKHGDIFVTPLDDRNYVYRYIKRQEWAQLLSDEGFQKMNELQTEEFIYDRCVLWPKLIPQQKAIEPAGTFTTIAQTIRLASGFVNPEALIQFTIKL
jgi:hypothetical protein